MSTRTITLTGRPPVTIDEDKWPLLASAGDSEADSEHRFQANRTSEWSVRVRRHNDGRAIVYATYKYSTNWANERDFSAKRGVLLPAASDNMAICTAIEEVCDDIANADHEGDDAARWMTIAAECIADLPAEVLE